MSLRCPCEFSTEAECHCPLSARATWLELRRLARFSFINGCQLSAEEAEKDAAEDKNGDYR